MAIYDLIKALSSRAVTRYGLWVNGMRFDRPRRRRYAMVLGLSFGAANLGFLAVTVGVVNRLISMRVMFATEVALCVVMLAATFLNIAVKRRLRLCDSVIHDAERQYLFLARISEQAGVGMAEASEDAKTRWFGEINRFIDQYIRRLSKPVEIKIINQCRADLVTAIDRLVVPDIEAR